MDWINWLLDHDVDLRTVVNLGNVAVTACYGQQVDSARLSIVVAAICYEATRCQQWAEDGTNTAGRGGTGIALLTPEQLRDCGANPDHLVDNLFALAKLLIESGFERNEQLAVAKLRYGDQWHCKAAQGYAALIDYIADSICTGLELLPDEFVTGIISTEV